MQAEHVEQVAPRAPKASFASRLFGYDVFISFALGAPPRGSQSYASDLARRLRERDLSVFYSEDELPPGEPLSGTLKRALTRSRLLVVVLNEGTAQRPGWVRVEAETFRALGPGRPVMIPVCLDGCLRDAELSSRVQPWLAHTERVWLDEQPEAAARGLATDDVVARLLTAPRRLRANALWRAVIAATTLSLAALAAAAAWQAVVARQERDRATALRDQALSRQLAAQSATALVRDPTLALLLAVQARAVARSAAADAAVMGALAALTVSRLQQHTAAFQALAVAPSGDALRVSDARGAVFGTTLDEAALNVAVPPVATPGPNLYGAVTALAWAPDGRTWAHAGSSRAITVHAPGGDRVFPDGDSFGESTPSFVLGLAFSPDGASLAAASTRRTLRLHDVATGGSRLLLNAAVDLASVAFSRDGRWLVAGGDRGYLKAVAVAPGVVPPALQAEPVGTVTGLAFDAAGTHLVAASRGGRIEVFDARSGLRIAAQDAPEHGSIDALAVSADGRFIATGHGNGTVLRWSWRPNQAVWPRQVLLRHAGPVAGLAFASDGRRLVTAGQDGRLYLALPVDQGRWQRRPGPPVLRAAPAPAEPRGVRSADNQWIAWAGTTAPPPPPFAMDFGRRQSLDVPRLTLLDARDRRVRVDGGELPAGQGEAVVGEPAFAADSTRVGVQVGERLLFWDLASNAPLDAAVPLPPGTRLLGAAPEGAAWIAAADANAPEHYVFDGDVGRWVGVACRLAGRALTRGEWGRYVGEGRGAAVGCGG